MLSQPKLLLLDEPTANLDVDTEQRVLRTIAERLAKDTTLVLVTHKLQLVNLVQRVMVVANGEIAIDGPTQEVLQRLQRPQPQPLAAPKVQVQTASPQPQPAPASPAGQEGTEA